MSALGLQISVLFLGALGALAALALWRRRRPALAASALLLLASAGAVAGLEARRARPPAEEEVRARPNQRRGQGYVSSNTCQGCHPEQHASWHASYHRTMTQVASRETVIGDFDGRERALHGRRFRFLRDNASPSGFAIELDDPPGSSSCKRHPIVLSTGLHHMQAYWYSSGESRELRLAPFVFLSEERRWVPERSTFLKPIPQGVQDFAGIWNRGCCYCHTTAPQPQLAAMDSGVGEFGIACEACHGPAEEHVAANRDPRRRYQLHQSGGPDPTIANPRRMDAQRASAVCGQCHSNWSAASQEESDRSYAEGFSFRPGAELSRSKFIVHRGSLADARAQALIAQDPHYLADRAWGDGTVRVSGREYVGLLDSPCANHGDPTRRVLSCLDCHLLHKSPADPRPLREWADDQLRPAMAGDRACLQCHETIGKDIPKHSHHAAGSPGSACLNCHMPHTTYGLLKAIRSHTISAPTLRESLSLGRPNACNLCHLDKTLAWTAEFLDSWFGQARAPLDADQRGIAASVLWTLKGDAGQRALMAWHFGWREAQATSGSDWMAPYLAQLLADPYDAVRCVAERSLRRLPGAERYAVDFTANERERQSVAAAIHRDWTARGTQKRHRAPELLIDGQGRLDEATWTRLFEARDLRRVSLEE